MKEDNNNPLPPEFDWENMKEGIFAKMQASEGLQNSQVSPKKSQRKTGIIFLLLALLIAIPYALFERTKSSNNQDLGKPENIIKNYPQKTNRANSPQSEMEEIEKTPTLSPINVSKSNAKSIRQSEKKTGNDHTLSEILEEKTSLARGTWSKGVRDNGADSAASKNNSKATLISQYPTMKTFKSYDAIEDYLSFINPSNTKIHEEWDDFAWPSLGWGKGAVNAFDGKFTKKHSSNNFSDFLSLEGGLTLWNEAYRGDKPENAQYQRAITSYQIQAHYTKYFRVNYFFQSGFQFQMLESKFQYQNTIENYPIIIRNTLLRVQNDLISGQYENIYGDLETRVQAQHRVIHYNKTKLFKASFAAGRSWQLNTLQIDLYAGAALNTLVNNNGRMFYQDTIVNYNGTSNAIIRNQLMVDGILGARLHYPLRNSVNLTAGFQGQRSITNWSKVEGLRLYPWSLGLQFGLSYRLD